MILKPNMVTAGSSHPKAQGFDDEVADMTVRALAEVVPPAVPGVLFLSGGQTEAQATDRLALMNKKDFRTAPWTLSFSYGRALQASCLKAWGGKAENVKAAQDAFAARCKANSDAAKR